jgi:hypothetical protein
MRSAFLLKSCEIDGEGLLKSSGGLFMALSIGFLLRRDRNKKTNY